MSTLNVLRYSFLGLGLLVGLKTDIGLRCQAKKDNELREYQSKVDLIEEAKAAYQKTLPKKKENAVSGFTLDKLEDPNIDFSAVILNSVESLK
ncbi:F1F0 ATP synthase subunit e SCDLUD_004715 [Saccharomycodes ludwigii]|uniref:F1F0 ATP synthase subunit e n=1 Tax=Saccharomycodes ludwigii TaxID=36035 RepID=UPI001E880A91|nr:hypothetical protein SCDLUD_004715 [Saccharomycodes ludwigii]KAH3899279.1 hypothetical protein SCDLUD_004715 [Saccharomycodes ludwigii]